MNYHVLTLFPEMIEQGINTSITGRAINNNFITLNSINIRDFSENKHKKVDDYPYGGGAGMVMQAQPVLRAYESVIEKINTEKTNEITNEINYDFNVNIKNIPQQPRVIYLTPQGNVFNQKMAKELSQETDLVFLCGHYEGIDERILELIVTDYVSIGDYVLTGGELPAMVMIDAISRLVPGVLNNDASAEFESFQDNLLEHPQYTRPEVFLDKKVPDVLLSGHHSNVDAWRREQSILRTLKWRPDLLDKAILTDKELNLIKHIKTNKNLKNK